MSRDSLKSPKITLYPPVLGLSRPSTGAAVTEPTFRAPRSSRTDTRHRKPSLERNQRPTYEHKRKRQHHSPRPVKPEEPQDDSYCGLGAQSHARSMTHTENQRSPQSPIPGTNIQRRTKEDSGGQSATRNGGRRPSRVTGCAGRPGAPSVRRRRGSPCSGDQGH